MLSIFKGNSFAKAAIEICDWTLQSKIKSEPLHKLLGGDSKEVIAGADFGILDSFDELLLNIQTAVDKGFPRVKLKAAPGWDLDMLKEGEVIDAIERIKEAGKVRFIGYSGDNEAAQWASLDSRFDSIQTSFNLLDQGAKDMVFPGDNKTQKGLIAKRPIANGAWGVDKSPAAYAREYFRRYEIIKSNGINIDTDLNSIDLSLAVDLSHQTINVHIVGTTNLSHLKSNIKQVESGLLLDEKALLQLYEAYDNSNDNWLSQT